MKTKYIRYAIEVLKKDFLLKLGIVSHRCLNTPYLVYFCMTYRCNARCITCYRWKSTDHSQELSLEESKRMILQLSNWAGPCNITFTGGEPLVKEGSYELLRYANSLRMITNVCSNGLIFDEEGCKRVISTGVDAITFSLNSIDPALHDYYKGTEGIHQKVVSAIHYMRTKTMRPNIGILCLITKNTYKSLVDFARWAYELGAETIDFQPISNIHTSTLTIIYPPFLTDPGPFSEIDDLAAFDRQIDLLVAYKDRGLPIVTPTDDLKKLKTYFRNIATLPRRPCDVGFRNLFIASTGDIQLCLLYPAIGNVRKGTLRDVWFSEEAQKQRRQMLSCDKPCLSGCLRRYRFTEKLQHFLIRSGLRRSGGARAKKLFNLEKLLL